METPPKKTQEEIDARRLSLKEVIERATNAAEALSEKKNKSESVTSGEKVGENNEEKREASIEEVALLLKNNKIDQIIIAGEKRSKEKNLKSKEKIFALKPDLDTLTALYLLNDFNKKSETETYNDGAMTSAIEKGGEGKDLIEDKNGIKIFLDVSGNWLEVEKGEETTTIYIDHHGAGKREPTSGAKMMMDIMEKAEILKEKPEWLNKFVSFVNDIDNLSYLDKKDNKNRKVFTENYFRNEWPNSLYALAEKQIPFEQLIELCKSGTIKDLSTPFTTEELNGEIGNTKIGNTTIKELCAQQKEQVEQVLDGVKNSITNNKKMGLNLETESLGKIIYQDYFKIRGKVNMIPDHLAFKATKAKGFDTYISWNKQKNSFYLNSSNPNLSKITEKLNEVDPECAKDVRGVMIFGKIKNLTEEQFLNIIDPKILEGKNTEVENKELEGQNIDDNKEKERQEKINKIVEQLTNSILETQQLESHLDELIALRQKLIDENEAEENSQEEVVTSEEEPQIEITFKEQESSEEFKEIKMEDFEWSYPDYTDTVGEFNCYIKSGWYTHRINFEIKKVLHEMKPRKGLDKIFSSDENKKVKLEKPYFELIAEKQEWNSNESKSEESIISYKFDTEEVNSEIMNKVNEIAKDFKIYLEEKRIKAEELKKKEIERRIEEDKEKRKDELELKINEDRANKPFLYFAFEKSNNPTLLHYMKNWEFKLLDLSSFDKDSVFYSYDNLKKTYGNVENEGFFEFNTFGFIMSIKNVSEVTNEDRSISNKSEKAIYRIIGPDGKVFADDVKGYTAAESIYKEETEKYKKQVEEEFKNLNNKNS